MSQRDIRIAIEDARQADVVGFITEANGYLRTLYPDQSNHPVDVDALSRPGVAFFAARRDGTLLGSIALRPLGPGHAEIKRLFVRDVARGHGLGRRLLMTLEGEAKARGVERLSLEVGIKQPQAIRLYRRSGYQDCGPFGTYRADPLSLFMTKQLVADQAAP
jgi:putative acetyltransferase